MTDRADVQIIRFWYHERAHYVAKLVESGAALTMCGRLAYRFDYLDAAHRVDCLSCARSTKRGG